MSKRIQRASTNRADFRHAAVGALVLAAFAGVAANAHGQVRLWNAAASGNWNVPANWTGGDVPDSAGESANIGPAGSYVVTLPAGYSASIGTLDITTSGVEVFRADNGAIVLSTALTNNGLLRINNGAGGNATVLRALNGNVVLSGSGTLRLHSNGNLDTAFMQWNSNPGGEFFTQNAGHSIRGTGNIYARLDNAGLVDADAPGFTLQFLSQNKNNSGSMRASAGTLSINGVTVTQTGAGTIASAGGTVNFISATVIGGAVSNTGGAVNTASGTTIFSSVSKTGTLQVADSTALSITGGSLSNAGSILVNTGVGGNGTALRSLNGPQTLSGPGAIVLQATANLDTAIMQWNSDPGLETFVQAQGHTIRGTGNIYSVLANSGLVNADQNTQVLQLIIQNKSNSSTGVFRASNGGTLTINGVTVTNSGVVEALTGSSVLLSNGTINGGTLNASGSGVFNVVGTSGLSLLTNNAPIQVADNATLASSTGSLVNNGTITVNTGTGTNVSSFRAFAGIVTLNGTGALVLNATSNLGTAQVIWNSNPAVETLANGPSHTIAGKGIISARLFNNGTLSPGVAPGSSGQLDFNSQICTMSSTSRFLCNINGTAVADFDRLTGTASRALNGTLQVVFGYNPTTLDEFDIITGPYTGRFTTLILPKGYYIEYGPTVKIVFNGCISDWDQDGDSDSDDITQFFTDFENGESDFDQDGDADSDDIIAFFAAFEAGC